MELFRENGIALYIEEPAFKKMIAAARKVPGLEAGGIILGRKQNGWEKYIISDVGIPTGRDTQKPFSFIRNKENAQELTNRFWQKSNGEINHIGEWHSHIFPSPRPSPIDRNDMKRAYTEGEYIFDHFFTIIVSSDLRLFVGIVEKGIIVYSQIIKVEKECTDILWAL